MKGSTTKELKGSRTEASLMAAFAGKSQARNKYTYYASKAEKDGYGPIAGIFRETAGNEKDQVVIWRRRSCGFLHMSQTAPELCPACKHPQAYLEIAIVNQQMDFRFI